MFSHSEYNKDYFDTRQVSNWGAAIKKANEIYR